MLTGINKNYSCRIARVKCIEIVLSCHVHAGREQGSTTVNCLCNVIFEYMLFAVTCCITGLIKITVVGRHK
jgi:hypothetical protein